MAKTFKIRICDLLLKLPADTQIFRCSQNTARAITAVFGHYGTQLFHISGIFIEPDIIRKYKINAHIYSLLVNIEYILTAQEIKS